MSLYVLSQWAVSGSATLLTMSGSVKLLIAGVVFALSVFHISRRKSALRSFSDPQYLILIALYGYSLLSVLWSFERDVSLGVFLANIPYIVVLVLVAPMLVRKKEDLNAFCFSFLFFSGCTLVLMALFREWGERGLMLPGARADTGNWTDFESSPLDLGTAAGLCILICLGLFKESKMVLKLMLLSVVGVMVFVMLRAGVRGQMLFCAASIGVYFFALGKRGAVFFFLTIAVTVFLFLGDILSVLFPENQNLIDRWAGEEISRGGNERLHVQTLMLNELADAGVSSLLFGLGASSSFSVAGIYPHNIFVEALTELGVVGTAVLIFFLSKALLPFIRRNSSASWRSTGSLLVSFVAYLILVSMKQGNIYGATLLFGFCLVVNPVLSDIKKENARLRNR